MKTNGQKFVCTQMFTKRCLCYVQIEQKTKDRSLSVKKYFQKVSVLCTDESFVFFMKSI